MSFHIGYKTKPLLLDISVAIKCIAAINLLPKFALICT